MHSQYQNLHHKVPQVTILFWLIKILATTLGETGGDALSMSFGLGYLLSTGIFSLCFFGTVLTQIRFKNFHAPWYWLTMVATTTVGTTLADFVDRSLGMGYLGGTIILISLLGISLWTWYRVQGSISVQSIQNRKSEIFYWTTIMFSQTLGTALGDWTANTQGIGYGGGILVFGSILTLIALAYFVTKINHTLLFWCAFISTRPLGAVLGDYLDKPTEEGGMELSRYTATAILLSFMTILIIIQKIIYKSKHQINSPNPRIGSH